MIPAASTELLLANLSSPVVLAFVLGALARALDPARFLRRRA